MLDLGASVVVIRRSNCNDIGFKETGAPRQQQTLNGMWRQFTAWQSVLTCVFVPLTQRGETWKASSSTAFDASLLELSRGQSLGRFPWRLRTTRSCQACSSHISTTQRGSAQDLDENSQRSCYHFWQPAWGSARMSDLSRGTPGATQ